MRPAQHTHPACGIDCPGSKKTFLRPPWFPHTHTQQRSVIERETLCVCVVVMMAEGEEWVEAIYKKKKKVFVRFFYPLLVSSLFFLY